jgi:hypothetical protein
LFIFVPIINPLKVLRMAKFINVTVNSVDRIFSAENVITTERTAATTTVITYNNIAGYDTCTFTHASDASTDKVVDAINDAIIAAHGNSKRPDVVIDVVLPVAVSGVVFS